MFQHEIPYLSTWFHDETSWIWVLNFNTNMGTFTTLFSWCIVMNQWQLIPNNSWLEAEKKHIF
jgi:hypothetical protein